MGRYNFAPQRVHTHATNLLRTANNQYVYPPPWLHSISQVPPPERLVRPALHRSKRPGKKSSRIFKPVSLGYEEDKLRWEYFNDHPWELARPRVVLENDGRDLEKWDWGVELDFSLNRPMGALQRDEYGRTGEMWDHMRKQLAGRPLNGESVIQRQNWLQKHTHLSPAAAYDKARKELYRVRHAREVETRVAREEALSTGAFFGPGPIEIGMQLEDKAYENWRKWALQETEALRQLNNAAYTGTGGEEDGSADLEPLAADAPELQEVSGAVSGSERGQEAKGGAVVHA